MVTTAVVVPEDPDFVLIRCFEPYDTEDKESFIETSIPMWTLKDRAHEVTHYKGTVGPLVARFNHLIAKGDMKLNSHIEYIYSTSNKVEKSGSPTGTVLTIADLLAWLKSIDEDLNTAKKLYSKELN